MTIENETLLTSLSIGKLKLSGRLFKTATSETRASTDGFVTESMLEFYRPMAQAGTPLIITGNIYVSLNGKTTPLQMGADRDDKIPLLSKLVASIHHHGGKIFAQISHGGRQVIPGFAESSHALSASTVKDLFTGVRPRALEKSEIAEIVENFAAAAERCRKAGFDGVQIHAAHGYLINQFLTPYTNRRKDEYGGTAENRVRLLREVHSAIRARVGSDYPVIIKLNGSDYLPLRRGLATRELVAIAKVMEGDGIDAVEVSVGHYESGFPGVRGTFWRCLRGMLRSSVPHLGATRRIMLTITWPLVAMISNLIWRPREGYNLKYATRFKEALSIPVICVGGFVTRKAINDAIAQHRCDAVSAGRAFIADPHFYKHICTDTPGPHCVDCNACTGVIGTQGIDCYHPVVRAQKDAMLAASALQDERHTV